VTKFITIVAVDWVTLLSCLSPTVVLNTPVSEPFNGLYYKPAMIIKVYCKLKCLTIIPYDNKICIWLRLLEV